MIPSWDRTGMSVQWKGQSYSWILFYEIHEKLEFLLSVLKNDEKSLKAREDERFSEYLIQTSYVLGGFLSDISSEGTMEAFHASVVIQRYLSEGCEEAKLDAILTLQNVKTILCLDQLFRRKEDGRQDYELLPACQKEGE